MIKGQHVTNLLHRKMSTCSAASWLRDCSQTVRVKTSTRLPSSQFDSNDLGRLVGNQKQRLKYHNKPDKYSNFALKNIAIDAQIIMSTSRATNSLHFALIASMMTA